MPSRRDLPQLLDCRWIQRELDVTRATAEPIMRQLPKVVVPGLRKTAKGERRYVVRYRWGGRGFQFTI